MSGISSVNAQEMQQINNTASSGAGTTQATQSGKLDNLTFQVKNDSEVDPTTKDDELFANIKSEVDAKRAKRAKDDSDILKRVNALLKKEKAQDVNEQQQQGKRIAKNTERVLQSISQFTQRDSEQSIGERSNKLFSGSEEIYKEIFKSFESYDKLQTDKKGNITWEVLPLTKEAIKENISKFKDVAEQHNTLQIVVDTWERKLTQLQNLKNRKFPERNKNPENQSEYKNLEKQIQQFESNLEMVKEAQVDLLARNKDRIESSYSLAPLLREVSAKMTKDVEVPPKTLHELILDEVLPLSGDENKVFKCLDQNLNKLYADQENKKTDYSNFITNMDRALEALRNEANKLSNNTLSPSVLGAILNACRTTEKLQNTHTLNVMLVAMVSKMVNQI